MLPKHQNPTRGRRGKGGPFWATAPYNFVPLPDKVVTVAEHEIPPHDTFAPGTFSGYLDCTLETKTPLYVRAMQSKELFDAIGETPFYKLTPEQQNEVAQFFTLYNADCPVIPGSSLRGMLRTLIEIVAYGKVQDVTNEPLIFRAVGDTTSLGEMYRNAVMQTDPAPQNDRRIFLTPRVRAGYLEKDGSAWQIRPAGKHEGVVTFARIPCKIQDTEKQEFPYVAFTLEERTENGEKQIVTTAELVTDATAQPVPLEQYEGCRNAFRIWVELGKYDYQDVQEGHIQVKYAPVLSARAQDTDGYQEAVVAFSGPMDKKKHEAVMLKKDDTATPLSLEPKLVSLYRDQVSPEQEKLLGEDGALRPNQPVFYLEGKEGIRFFGHTMMLRLPYDKSPLDFVPRELRRDDEIDLAEALFGFVPRTPSDKRQARAGRVFFSDAICTKPGKDVWLAAEPFPPKILASPKATTFQHYLTQQQPDDQVVGCNKKGEEKWQALLDHYGSKTPMRTVIRGTKFYWHHGEIKQTDIQELDTNKLADASKQYTKMRPIRDKVQFHFTIRFENLTPVEMGALLWTLRLPAGHYPKIGMGKPFGMGAVELVKVEPIIRNRRQRYEQLFANGGTTWNLGADVSIDEAEWRRAFETFVLERMNADERGEATQLSDVERIQMLFAVLKWPGPPIARTRAMQIELPTGRGDETVNEFKARPVLPNPLAVLTNPPMTTHGALPRSKEVRAVTAPRNQTKRESVREQIPTTGEILEGTFSGFTAKNPNYGFIKPEGQGKDVFVHRNDLKGLPTLQAGNRVRFRIVQGEKGPRAAQVEIITTASLAQVAGASELSKTKTNPVEETVNPSSNNPESVRQEYRVNQKFKGKVREIEDDGAVLLEMPGLDYQQAWGMIYPEDVNKPYQRGKKIRVQILDISRVEDKTIYICKPALHQES